MDGAGEHKGWHSRGYLPHLDAPGEIQALTFRLADSIPNKVMVAWRKELTYAKNGAAELRKRIAKYEDEGHGSGLLRIDENAEIVESCLLRADGQRYRLLEWCIMPNHVHVLIGTLPGLALGQIVRTWKTFSSRAINERHGGSGSLWAQEYHDRYIRDQKHFDVARAYIRNNPVSAGLCEGASNWRWGSAFYGEGRHSEL